QGRRRTTQIEVDAVPIKGQLDFYRDEPFALCRIEVEVVNCFPLPLRQVFETFKHRTLDIVLAFLHRFNNSILGILFDQAQHFTLARGRSSCLCIQIPQCHIGCATVSSQQLGDIMQQRTVLYDPYRCYAKSLAKLRARIDVKRAEHITADIGPVSFVLRESDDFIINKNGADETDVVQLRAASVRIVDGEDITRIDLRTKFLDYSLALEMQCADVNRDVATALHYCIALCVA